jgi:hypothetical protein
MNAHRLQIYSIDPDLLTSLLSLLLPPARPSWTISANSAVKASIYAPDPERITITDTSALYGRVVANRLRLLGDAAIFYDPALDTRGGYTSAESALYDAGGAVRAPFRSMPTLNVADAQAAADATQLNVRARGARLAPATTPPPDVISPFDPTPRPIRIDLAITSFGQAVHEWENGG